MNSKRVKTKANEMQAQIQEMKDKCFKFAMNISFELTRRCNMKCLFCARGNAQNLDMSKEIIDKVLDEIQLLDIFSLRLNGGEPFLAKEGLIYLANEVIRRGIKVCEVGVFTNGTVQDPDIKDTLIKLGNYCKKLSETPWGQRMMQIAKSTISPVYNVKSCAYIILSTYAHDNSDIINDTLKFYNDNVDPKILHAVNQEESYMGNGDIVQKDAAIVLRGNAKKNFQKLFDEGYRNFSLHERNDFVLIDDSTIGENYISITKALSIAANGKVFPGCLEPYDKLDEGENVICDILECNSDLFSHIMNYCWNSPLTQTQAKNLENCYTILWYYENGFKDCWLIKSPLSDEMINAARLEIEAIELFKQGLQKFHKLFPKMTVFELNTVGAIKFGYEIKNMELRKIVLTDICGLKIGEGDDGMLPDFTDKTLEDFLDGYEKHIYYNGDTLPSDALIEQATKDAVAKVATPGNIIAGLLLAGLGAAVFSKAAEVGEKKID